MGRNFSSDHVAPACDAILSALNKANEGFVTSYGGDELTAKLQSVASEMFEKQVAVFPVISGTAANALALSQIVPPSARFIATRARTSSPTRPARLRSSPAVPNSSVFRQPTARFARSS